MPDLPKLDVDGYYKAKEPYERLLMESKIPSATEKKSNISGEDRAQDLDPMFVPTLDGVMPAELQKDKDDSVEKK